MKIAFVGAGNLATNLANAFFSSGIEISAVASKNYDSAVILAKKVNSKAYKDPRRLPVSDIYFICTPDAQISEVAIYLRDKFVVHCSGATDIDVLLAYSNNYGVFYPLFTFNRNKIVDFEHIPIFVEGNTAENQSVLFQLAKKISKNVNIVDSQTRLKIHTSAVIANNFVNHLLCLSKTFAEKNGIDFKHFIPIIQETFAIDKLENPCQNQTGPAVRRDFDTIRKHIRLLEQDDKTLAYLYEVISRSIIEFGL